MTATDRVLEALGPALADRAGPLLAELVGALVAPLVDVEAYVAPVDDDRDWPIVFDLDDTVQPTFLAQLAGTTVPPGLDTAAQRAWVQNRPGWRRGTPDQIRAALLPLLVGYRRIDIYERDTSPWRLTVRVYAAQLAPGVTAADVRAAVLDQKPVGIVMAAEAAAGAGYAHIKAHHGATLADFAAAFPTYEQARTHMPEEGSAA